MAAAHLPASYAEVRLQTNHASQTHGSAAHLLALLGVDIQIVSVQAPLACPPRGELANFTARRAWRAHPVRCIPPVLQQAFLLVALAERCVADPAADSSARSALPGGFIQPVAIRTGRLLTTRGVGVDTAIGLAVCCSARRALPSGWVNNGRAIDVAMGAHRRVAIAAARQSARNRIDGLVPV